jgi:hypothetical protein
MESRPVTDDNPGRCGRALSTGQPCPDHPVSDNNDRRERYAAALYETLEVSPKRNPWKTLSPFRRAVWYARADAAMAVADAEIKGIDDLRIRALDRGDQLREENDRLCRALERVEGFRLEALEKVNAEQGANARLRAELRDVKEVTARQEQWLTSLRATIGRVRALRKHGPTLTWDEIADALKGEANV